MTAPSRLSRALRNHVNLYATTGVARMIPNFEPDDVFEPSHYAGVRRRWDTAETLPGWCYTSARFYQRERERIFFRYWNCIGHQSRVPELGSYLAFDFIGVPLIV